MAEAKRRVDPIPDGYGGTIAHLVVHDGSKAIEFYKTAFGGEETYRVAAPDGRVMHAELRLAWGMLFVCDDFPEWTGKPRSAQQLGGTPVTLHHYVSDVDATMARAAAAGATVTMPATDMFWGDRYGKLTDPFGHEWSFATHIEDVTPEQRHRAAQQAFGGETCDTGC